MNRVSALIMAALISLAAAGAQAQPATPAPTPVPKGYDAFNLVKTRNIFDPTRRAVRIEIPQEPRNNGGGNRTRPSSFTLTGTMVAEGRSLAFFSGSRSEYSKVVPVGESVGGYKIVSITPAQAELEHGGKNFVVGVGHRMQVDGSTEEVPASETAAPADSAAPVPAPASADPGSNPSSSSPTAAPAAGGDKAEILRRMMERRQKEMTK